VKGLESLPGRALLDLYEVFVESENFHAFIARVLSFLVRSLFYSAL
jgi:hypothetical protein